MRKFFISAALLSLLSAFCGAQSYPVDYGRQTVRILSQGPVVFARVSTLLGEKFVIGYKRSGSLMGTDHINLYLKVHCSLVFSTGTNPADVVKKIRMPAEWHGTGFITAELPMYGTGSDSLIYNGYGNVQNVEVAFYVNNVWDSNGGGNYRFDYQEFYRAPVFYSRFSDKNIAIDSWNHIISAMSN